MLWPPRQIPATCVQRPTLTNRLGSLHSQAAEGYLILSDPSLNLAQRKSPLRATATAAILPRGSLRPPSPQRLNVAAQFHNVAGAG